MCGGSAAEVIGRRLNGHQGLRARKRTGIATTVVRCTSCGLVYSNPRPVPMSLGQHYDRPPEEYWAASSLHVPDDFLAPTLATFQSLWRGSGAARALDVGAGLGHRMSALAKAGFETHGVEPSPAFRSRAIDLGISPERLQLASAETADYEPASFAFINFAAVLEHLQDPAAALARALGWLAPDGLVFVEVPSANWLIARALNVLYRIQGVGLVTNLSPMHPPFHLYEFTREAFARHGAGTGYEIVHDQVLVCDPFVPRPFAAAVTQLMDRTGTGMQLQLWLRRT